MTRIIAAAFAAIIFPCVLGYAASAPKPEKNHGHKGEESENPGVVESIDSRSATAPDVDGQQFVWPVHGWIGATSHYPDGSVHPGAADIYSHVWQPIRAAHAGKVVFAGLMYQPYPLALLRRAQPRRRVPDHVRPHGQRHADRVGRPDGGRRSDHRVPGQHRSRQQPAHALRHPEELPFGDTDLLRTDRRHDLPGGVERQGHDGVRPRTGAGYLGHRGDSRAWRLRPVVSGRRAERAVQDQDLRRRAAAVQRGRFGVGAGHGADQHDPHRADQQRGLPERRLRRTAAAGSRKAPRGPTRAASRASRR